MYLFVFGRDGESSPRSVCVLKDCEQDLSDDLLLLLQLVQVLFERAATCEDFK